MSHQEAKPVRLVIVVQGGQIQAICSDDPDAARKVDLVQVDYDVEGAAEENETCFVKQDGRDPAEAIVSGFSIDEEPTEWVDHVFRCDAETNPYGLSEQETADQKINVVVGPLDHQGSAWSYQVYSTEHGSIETSHLYDERYQGAIDREALLRGLRMTPDLIHVVDAESHEQFAERVAYLKKLKEG